MIKSILTAVGAMAVAAVPVAAQAGTTASASIGKVGLAAKTGPRQSGVVKKKQNVMAGLSTGALVAIGAAGVAATVAVAASGGDDNASNGS